MGNEIVLPDDICEGNYSAPCCWRWVKNPFYLTSFDVGKHFSTQLEITTINLHEESRHRIPQGIAAVCLQLGVADTGSSTNNCFANLYRKADPANLYALQVNIGNNGGLAAPNNGWAYEQGIVPCDRNGNIAYRCCTSAPDSMSIALIVVGISYPISLC